MKNVKAGSASMTSCLGAAVAPKIGTGLHPVPVPMINPGQNLLLSHPGHLSLKAKPMLTAKLALNPPVTIGASLVCKTMSKEVLEIVASLTLILGPIRAKSSKRKFIAYLAYYYPVGK